MVDTAVAVRDLNVVQFTTVPHPVVVGQAFVCLVAIVEVVAVDVLYVSDLEHLRLRVPFVFIIPAGTRCKIGVSGF